MTDRIANQMGQGLGDDIQKALVQVGVLAAYDQFHVLAALLGNVAHHPGKAAEKLLDRNHADLHHRALQITQHA